MINRWKAGEKQEKPRDPIQKVHRRPHRARSCKVRARLRQEFRRLQAACGAVSWDILGYGLGTHTSTGFPSRGPAGANVGGPLRPCSKEVTAIP